MSACNCMGSPNCCKYRLPQVVGVNQWPLPEPPYKWVPEPWRKMPNTAGPIVEPEPSRTVPDDPFVPNDDPSLPMALPLAGSWQCAGCGRIYNMTVNSCDCQIHRWTYNSDRISIHPGHSTLPAWGTFATGPRTVGEGE